MAVKRFFNLPFHPSGIRLHKPRRVESASLFLALEFVAERSVVTPLQTAFFALSFTGLDQVLQAARAFGGRLAAFRAAFIPLHAQLILALPRDLQVRELVLDSWSHWLIIGPVEKAHRLFLTDL